MNKSRKLSGLVVALLAGAPSVVWAQGIALPGAAVPGAVAAPSPALGAAPPPAAAPTKNIWTMLCPSEAQKAKCKAKFCASQFGQLFNNTLAPVSVFTGGVIGQPCPLIDPAALGLPPDSALGAASQVQKDTAEAAAKRAAIRYLSTVDCNWWPEVTAALVNSMRAERNECVRLEAALALRRGCCCNRITIKGLVNALSVFPDDGNPREDSPRVRGAAMASLQHCLACYVALAPVPPPPPPARPVPPPGEAPLKGPPLIPVPAVLPPPAVAPAQASVIQAQHPIQPAAYSAAVGQQSMEQVVQEARRVLQQAQQQQAEQQRRNVVAPFQPGDRCLLTVIETALHPPPSPTMKNSPSTSPPQAVATDSRRVEPPVLRLVPQVPPPILSPRPNPIPTVSPAPLTAPAPVAPLSLKPSRPAVAPSPAATMSPNSTPSAVANYGPRQPALPVPNSRTTPVAVASAASVPQAILKPTAPSQRKPVPEVLPSIRCSRPNPTPAVSPAPLAAPVPVAPVSRESSRPTAAPSPAANVSSTSEPLVSKRVSSQPTAAPAILPMPGDACQQPDLDRLLWLLKKSENPRTRQWAAKLLTYREDVSPIAIAALMSAAAADASDHVRDACLRGLLRLGVGDPGWLAKLDWPFIDRDPRVREAAWRLVLFGKVPPNDPRVRKAAKTLHQWLQSRLPAATIQPS